ncbi:TetR/AcrR family transcriptional regulator [Mycobacterium sp. CVI_P3]|uniref:TetR/AcrR family transcriptional regulator n=1 Tax=Mycobacterium pinniadriaticum TaxID=2994102 RepID=A0ABT3SAA9_9MYCO|nr:TetR/AcrR family transcriptional regulator [Mycobacterium pinniadriaticum]MCX2929882.1 TetR/AcrR family transcriptional regulator [Mycobacterium pinniadriaticum]MCX2936469.1 TetR/AcrR family transcriptional regulator [Mycobacterium pinniadriaticum]
MATDVTRRRRRMTPEDRRAQILAAARSVFLDYGFAGTRVRDIAERAGITENLVYVRFANKNEIYQAAVTDPLDRLVEHLASTITEMSAAGQSRRELFEAFHAELYTSMVEMAPLLAAALFSVPEVGRAYYSDVFLPQFTEAISGVITDVTGFDVDSLELDVLVEGVLGLHLGLSLDSIFATQPVPVDVVARTLTVMFGDGVTARKDQKLRLAPTAVKPSAPVTEPARAPEPGTRLTAAERKAQVALAAREVFVERGLAMARTKEIADRAGITEAFMFRLFDGKEELYTTAIEDPAAELVNRWATELGRIAARGADPVTTLLAINEDGIAILEELAPLFMIAVFSRMKRGKRFYRKVVEPALSRPLRSQPLDAWASADVNTEVVWRAIFGIQLGIVLRHELTGVPLDTSEVARQLTGMIVSGIRRPAVPRK